MRAKLLIVSLMVASFCGRGRLSAQSPMLPQSDGGIGRQGAAANVTDGAVGRISVGDEPALGPEPPVPPVAPALGPSGYGMPNCTTRPSFQPPYSGGDGCTAAGCTAAGCTAAGCTAAGCTAACTDDCCGRRGVWGGLEYMHVWTKGSNIPPLAVNGAVLGDPVLFGNERIGDTLQSGGRLTAGLWTDDSQANGWGIRFLGLEGDRTSFAANTNQFPTLARPFLDVAGGAPVPNGLLVGLPGLITGNISVVSASDLYAGEVFGRFNLEQDVDYRVDLLGGYHFTRIDDRLSVTSVSDIQPGIQQSIYTDRFTARNEFHGGELGLLGEYGSGPWTVSMLAKFSIGQMNQSVSIRGNTSVAIPANAAPTLFNGGLLALGDNLGDFERNKVAYVPEAALTFNRELTPNLDLSIGYSFIYWSSVVMAGDQIDTTINSNQLNGGGPVVPNRPVHTFVETDYWLHAITFGLNGRF